MKNFFVNVENEGSKSDLGKVSIYPASESLGGLGRLFSEVLNTLFEGKVTRKPRKSENYEANIVGIEKGCFEFRFEINVNEDFVNEVGSSVLIDKFYDYLFITISKSVGLTYTPINPKVKSILEDEDKNFVFDDLAFKAHLWVKDIHSLIDKGDSFQTSFVRPRTNQRLILDKNTLAYIKEETISEENETWSGNVTSYNSQSGFGRAYIDELGRTTSFFIKNFDSINSDVQEKAGVSLRETTTSRKNKTPYRKVDLIGKAKRNKNSRILLIFLENIEKI
jgi:hypothetical protein